MVYSILVALVKRVVSSDRAFYLKQVNCSDNNNNSHKYAQDTPPPSTTMRMLENSVTEEFVRKRFLIMGRLAMLSQNGIRFLINWIMAYIHSWLGSLLRWCPTSAIDLEEAEIAILSKLKTPYKGEFVRIGSGWNNEDNVVWTVSQKAESPPPNATPLVMIHGFGSGVGLWVLNMDVLSAQRTVYAFDVLGFGRSSRPEFSRDGWDAEHEIVQSIERWRTKVGLSKFILLGHSMGGFLAASYAIQHPNRVAHLILADPWGFTEQPISYNYSYQLPFFMRAVVAMMKPFNPLATIRAVGPLGPSVVKKFRPDLAKKFSEVIQDENVIPNYLYHCNAQYPSGESAFKSMIANLGYAKHPMINRIGDLHRDVPITFIYGSRSWVDRQPGFQIKFIRMDSDVDVKIIQGAGHHVYADKPKQFNSLIENICEAVDTRQSEEEVRRNLFRLPPPTESMLANLPSGECMGQEVEKGTSVEQTCEGRGNLSAKVENVLVEEI